MDKWWLEWHDIKKIAIKREIVFYGRSEDWTQKALNKVTPSCIVDNNSLYHKKKYQEIPILNPKEGVYQKKYKPFIIITSGVYEGIISELQENGFIPGKDFSCCPDYRDFKLLDEFRVHDEKLLLTCSDYNEPTRARYSKDGGGLYLYDLASCVSEKIVSGSFRQIVVKNDNFYLVDYVACEILVLSKSFEIIRKYQLDAPNYCGLAYNESKNIFILVNTGKDIISIHSGNDFKLLDCIHYSKQKEMYGVSEHHINDVCTEGSNIYVTYFSHSGNWKKGIFDGGVSKIDLNDLSKPPVVMVQGLWKPHSPEIIDGNLCYLDSMRGRLYTNSQQYTAEFQSFTRGLAFDGRFYYVGSSEDMYMSERFGYSNNILLNAGFFMFDAKAKASRFFPMLGNMNIHDIIVLKK